MKSSRRSADGLVVLSADGMLPAFYRRENYFGVKLPNIRSLVEDGASADAVESICPTTTYPAHATLVTGVPPRVHGIYSHLASLDPTEPKRPWCWFAAALSVPTLWDVARASGRKTAAVSWPVSAGASINCNIPEIWNPAAPDPHRDLETVARHSTPGLFAEVLKSLQPLLPKATPDRLRGEAALYLWKHYRPDILLVHFVHYDQLAHRFGPMSPQALTALGQIDEEVGRIREAVTGPASNGARASGERVVLVVLSDHGFVPVEKEAAPLVTLAEEGLFNREENRPFQLGRLGAVHAGGSFAVYWLEEPGAEDRKALGRAVEQLCQTGAVQEVVDRGKLAALDADPDAELMLDAAPGFYFSDRFEGPVVRPTKKDHGTHGQLPSRPGLEASFIAVGPNIAAGKNLGRLALTQVAPTLARALGLPAEILASKERLIELG
jgi:predicted AlkP superfamily pyrophosphatase or phosphodiesterase